jgi:uncharacterized protein YjbJ (UPF0337 family)
VGRERGKPSTELKGTAEATKGKTKKTVGKARRAVKKATP